MSLTTNINLYISVAVKLRLMPYRKTQNTCFTNIKQLIQFNINTKLYIIENVITIIKQF